MELKHQFSKTKLIISQNRLWYMVKLSKLLEELSLDPPCQEKVSPSDKLPYTCDNCYLQLPKLKDTLRHRRSGTLVNKRNRLGLQGFNKRYTKKGEVSSALVVESQRRRTAEAKVKQVIRVALSPREWNQKLAINLVCLLKIGVSEKKPMQVLVIRNLVSKLKRTNNHHYVDLVEDISGLFKNQLGPSNYTLFADLLV